MQTSLDLLPSTAAELPPPSILDRATRELSDALWRVQAPEHIRVYNPLDYAWVAHERWLALAASGPRAVLFIGMNPGPHGMVQTGLPFGDVENAAAIQALAGPLRAGSFLDRAILAGPTYSPPAHLRPIEGYSFRRKEVSGQRFWGEFAPVFGGLKPMLEQSFVLNVCPLAFFGPADEHTPRSPAENVTPDKLPRSYREQILAPCRTYFEAVLRTLQPKGIVCMGRWAEKTIAAWVKGAGLLEVSPRIEQVQHPSPRVLHAAPGWHPAEALRERGFWAHCGIG